MKRFTLSAAAIWLVTTISTVLAEWQADPNFSIGLKQPLSSDGYQMPGWTVLGVSQVLRDRVIMTPPHPGSMRSAIWSEHANPYNEWSAEIDFRANGEERSGGSFHFWYTAGGAGYQGTDSVYTAKTWDGLAILVDKYGSYGGSVRGFLNDGKTDYSIHHNIASLAFGHCDFTYRNQGTLSKLKITHTNQGLKVEADGRTCFETRDVHLSASNYFGVSAASADSPDSFELFKFAISSPEVGHPQIQNDKGSGQAVDHDGHILGKHSDHVKNSQEPISNGKQELHGKLPHEKDFEEWKDEVPDKPASSYKTQEEQFKDLHDRLTALTHHLGAIQVQIGGVYDKVDAVNHRLDEFREESRHTRVPREQVDRMEGRLSAVENMIRELEKVLHTKDYSKHFDSIHTALRDQHSNLLNTVPESVANAVHERHGKLTIVVWLILGVQVMLVGGFVWYKRRKGVMPKKYL
ncbi:concanavalin A-like lectin/glucanase [Terfezia boudieri ATCC MYA-4762]|uniref:Concanavalin A-like lectin/glucanase n=1 Tax=Terfezia boudieri ATCC MYA-4762 TaxID=1051890 RepID=A0A3N4M1J5_9PEZI|nr:concanavalin A-like lectin/glucanase [Terfezia boudieri ATCC MYA-4762]